MALLLKVKICSSASVAIDQWELTDPSCVGEKVGSHRLDVALCS